MNEGFFENTDEAEESSDLAMDPMVDIVFQLLIFFLFSFQIKSMEIIMPAQVVQEKKGSGVVVEKKDIQKNIRMELFSSKDGSLKEVKLNEESVSSLNLIESKLKIIISNPEFSKIVEIWSDDSLKFENVINALYEVQRCNAKVQLGRNKG